MKSDNSFKHTDHSGNETIAIPESYSRIPPARLEEFQLPEGSTGYEIATENATGLVVCFPVSYEESMPLGSPDSLVDYLHSSMNENQGIIEVKNGKCSNGGRYVYYILKYRREQDDLPDIVGYQLNFNFEVGNTVYFISGSFEEEGITGQRDSIGLMILLNAKEKAGEPADMQTVLETEWFEDPYDLDYKQGFLMNRSESPEFDSVFPAHALSVARALVGFVIDNN